MGREPQIVRVLLHWACPIHPVGDCRSWQSDGAAARDTGAVREVAGGWRRACGCWDVEPLLNIPATLLVGIVLVIIAFNVASPISQFSSSVARGTLGIALACVLLSFMMMITRAKAIPQVIGFLSMENGLFFAAAAATNGMPMIVELGIGLDVLVGILILGVFMFQIREQFDSLDIHHLEKLKDD